MKTSATRIIPELFCTHCGVRNDVAWNPDYSYLRPCTACGQRIVDVMTLLWELHRGIDEFRECPKCEAKNCGDPYCYACGNKY